MTKMQQNLSNSILYCLVPVKHRIELLDIHTYSTTHCDKDKELKFELDFVHCIFSCNY